MPSEALFRRHKEAAKFAAWRRSGCFCTPSRILSLTHWEKPPLFAPFRKAFCRPRTAFRGCPTPSAFPCL
ncbi:hypothetical protein, partial [Neisseria gonorrhoeae]|uniref:hypothetical protein n=1 Tax=Neisseria gonorrhoeae TaxID=485 RepID=UPI001CE1CB4F